MALINQVIEEAKKQKATTTTKVNKAAPTGGLANKVKTSVPKTVAPVAPTPNVSPKTNGVTNVLNKVKEKQDAKASAATNILNKVKENKPVTNTGLTPNKGKSEILRNLRPQEETSEELKSVVEQLNKNYKINPYSALYDPNTQALEQRRQELMNEEKLQSEKKDLVTIPEYQKAYEEALAKGDKEEANRINEIIDALDDTSFERLKKSAVAGGKNAFATVANLPNIVADISYEKDALGYEEQYKRALAEGKTEEAEYYKERAEESRKRAEGFDALGDSNAVSQWANEIRNESQKIMELERIGASSTDMVMMDVADTVANMTPSIAANMVIPGSGLVVLGGQVFSSTYAQRIEEGYDMQTATNNALATASIEVASEMLGEVFGKAAKHIPGFSKLMDTAPAKVYVAISSKLSQYTPSYIQDMHSEGLEEVFSDIVQPWADYFTLPDKKEIEYKPGDIFRDYIMSYPTTLALGVFGIPGRVIKTSKQMYMAQHDLNVLNESEMRFGSLGGEFSSKMELAKRNLLSAIEDFKNNSVVASAIKVQSDMVEDITLDDYLNLYDEALKPTTDKVGSAINQEINESMQRALMLEAEYLAKNNINASPGVWAGVSEDIKNEVRELADKGTKLDFNKYITETDSNVRKAMVEIAEKNIKGRNGEDFDAREYMELTPEQKANAEQIGKIAKTIKGNVRAAKLRKGINGFRDSDARATVVSVDQTTTIDANKLMGMENFDAPVRENFKTEAEFLKAKNEFLENLSKEAGAQESAMTTVGHEVGHSVEETSVSEETENALKYLNGEYTDPYRDLKKAVTEYLGGEENFKKMADRIGAIYKLQNVDKFNAENEAVAFTVQTFAEDPEFFSRVAKYNDSVAYSMYRDFMATLTGNKKMLVENAYARGVAQANRLAAEDNAYDGKMVWLKLVSPADRAKAVNFLEADGAEMIRDNNENIISFVANDGSKQFNRSTYVDSGREILENNLKEMVNKKDITSEDADAIMKEMEYLLGMTDSLLTSEDSNKYEGFAKWADTKVELDANGNPVLSCVVSNGEYKMNIDFSRVCKKRATLNQILNSMIGKGIFDASLMAEEDYAMINQIIREHGFEVACGLCFVDSKRYMVSRYATTFANPWNAMIKAVTHGKNVSDFNYGGAEGRNTVDEQFTPDYEALEKLLQTPAFKSGENTKPLYRKMADLIEGKGKFEGRTDLALKALHTINPNDMVSSFGMNAFKKDFPELYGIMNGHMGVAKPKTAHTETQYQNEILKMSLFDVAKAFEIGGVRFQSFSDFRANMYFDYMQAFADMAAKGLPEQSYTKEPAFAKLYGLTGAKINMSILSAVDPEDLKALRKLQTTYKNGVIPPSVKADNILLRRVGLDSKGNYVWGTETFPVNDAFNIQDMEGYDRNCGTILVGLSYEHIKKALADKRIKMVIPYHKSGLPHIVATMNNIEFFTDYTDFQNEGDPTKLNDKGNPTKLTAEQKEQLNFNFYREMEQLAGEALAHSQGDPVLRQELLDEVPKRAAEALVRRCEEKHFTPRFAQFAYNIIDGSTEVKYDAEGNPTNVERDVNGNTVINPDYYKTITDYSLYDRNGHFCLFEDRDGNLRTQDYIHMNFPKNVTSGSELKSDPKEYTMEKYISEILKDQQEVSDRLGNEILDMEREVTERLAMNREVRAAEEGQKGKRTIFPDNTVYSVNYFAKVRNEKGKMQKRNVHEEFDTIEEARARAIEVGETIPHYDRQVLITKGEGNYIGRYDNGQYKEISSVQHSVGISLQTDSDSQGRKLSNEQREYFKDSKAVDDNGNLLTLYHGTPDGGFSVFDSSYSKDKRSLFFTDDPEVADTYNGGRNRSSIYPVYLNLKNPLIIDAKGASWNNIQNGEIKNLVADRNTIGDFTFTNEDDANSFEQKYHIQELTNLLEEAEKNGSVEYNGETYDDFDIVSLLDDARYKAEREYQTYHRNNSKRITIREFLDNYKDYGWYDLESLQDAYDDNGSSLLEIKESADNDYDRAVQEYIDFFKNEIEEGNADPSVYDITFDALPKSGESFEKMDLHNTRWFSEQAQKQGYDGVIIKNLVDRVYGNGASTVAIAYDSNQVKSIFNTNPTSNKDIRYSMGLKPEQTVRLKSGKIPAKVGKIIQKTYDAFDEGYSNDMEQFGVSYENVADEFLEAANEVATNGEISKETMDRLRDILYYGVENVYEPGERGKDVYEQIKDILKTHPLSNSAIGQKYVDYGADGKKHMTRLHKGMTQGTLNDMRRNGIRFKNGGYDLGELESVFKEAGLGQYFDERTFSDLEDFNKTLSDLQLTLQNQTHKSYDMAEFAEETEESFNQFFDETMKQFVRDVSGDYKLNRRKFGQTYHPRLLTFKDGAENHIEDIKKNGFFGDDHKLFKNGTELGLKKGDMVMLIPPGYSIWGGYEGGFKPKDFEILTADRNVESQDVTDYLYSLYSKEYDKAHGETTTSDVMSDQAAEVIDSLDVSDEEFNKFVKRDPISPRALENITKHKKELVDTAPEWIPNYDIIREKHPEFTDLEMNDALFEILSEGTISESTAWRIKEDMLRRNSVQTNNEADQSIKELVDDSLDYFAADAAYKMNKKAMNSVANKANTIIRSFTGQNVTESALDSYEQMEGLEKTLKQVEKRRGEVSAKNETMVKELLAAGADYGSSWMTLEQNLDKIAGTNSNLRQTLRDYFELPKYESQIKYVQFLQKYGDTLQGLVKDGIRAGTKESAAVQYMLEGHTETGAKYGQKELMEQFPDSWQKLDKAAKTLRNMYDEMYNLIETNRENTYGDIDAKYDLQLAKARDKANNARRTADQIKQKLSEKADARLEAMFNRADAQASKLERQYEQMLEDKATRDGTRRQKLQYRKNYAHHLTDQGGFFKQMKNALSDGSSVPTKLSGISNRAKPLSGFASFFQRQNAQTGYVADAIGGMAEYIKDASKIYAYDPYIEYLRFAASDIRAEASGNEMSRFVSWVDNYANGIAGKTQMLDRGIRETFGEKPLKVIKTLNNQARKNAIVGNLSTALVQFANLPNAIGVLSQYGGAESALDIARGLSAYASTLGRDGAESVSPFMSARYYDINTMKGNVAQRSLNGIAKTLLEFGDHEAAKMIWNCSYQQALRLNVDDPVMYADDLTRRSVAGRSVSELPLAMESQVLKLLMPFQVETNNTFHLMTGLMRDKKLGSLLAMLIGGWLMNGLYEAVIGRRPITDPIDAIIDGAQSDNPADIATRLGGELLSAIPGSSYAVSLFGLNDNQRKKLFGENDPSRYGTGNIGLSTIGSATMDLYNAFDKKDPRYAMNAVSDLASTYLAPGGGRQIQRTVEGLQSEGMIPQYVNGEWVSEPRYYTPSGKVGFVNDPNDIFDVITAGTFGRWATKAGKEYLENGGKYLSDQATRQLEALGGDQAAYDAVIAMRDMQGIPGVDNSKALQKRKYLEDQGLWDTFAENMDGEWGDYGLNKTVGNASEDEFNKLYSEVFGNEDMRLDVASAAGMKETLDTNKEEKETKTDANLDFLAGTPYEKAAIQNLDMDEDVLQTVTDLGYDYKTIKQIDDYIDNTDSLRKEDGSAIRNTKALQMRQYYEEMGVYDDIFEYISENGLDPQDYGLNKTVMGYSDSKFESQYSKYYGGSSSSSSSKSSGSSSSGSSRKSSKRKSSKKKGFSSEEEMKAFFDQLVANIGLSSSKSSTSAINNILKKSKNLRNTKFSKRSS